MIYRAFSDCMLSMLGMGGMRLPVIEGSDSKIDYAAAEEMFALALERGVNYYDTAWGYHGGNSEIVFGKILSKYPRDSFYLASKFPGYDIENLNHIEEIFEKQLEKCGVDYFDFYLVHNVCDQNIDAYLERKGELLPYLLKQKDAGRIRHLGFSTHGTIPVVERYLEGYGEHMEFCQIQLNWLDWTLQNAKELADLIRERGLPIWVMEPLRGGKLASVDAESEKKLKALRPNEDIPAWAFRFLQAIPDVCVILSGMSSLEQLQQNIATFETDAPLNAQEMDAILDVAEQMKKEKTVPCTACRYCTKNCPQELDIPALLEIYNEKKVAGGFRADMMLDLVPEGRRPGDCIACRACEETCPQQIKISETLCELNKITKK